MSGTPAAMSGSEDGRRGLEPRNASCLYKLEKVRNELFLELPEADEALTTPQC